jgi:hypothetical protein
MKLFDCYQPISEADVSNIETTIAFSFQERYRDFLLKNNGGDIPPNYGSSRKLGL